MKTTVMFFTMLLLCFQPRLTADWTQTSMPIFYGTVLCMANAPDGNLIASTASWGLFRSTDNGETWTSLNFGISPGEFYAILTLGENMYGATYQGVYRSTNNGLNWTQVNDGLTNLSIHCLASSGASIYAGSSNGVFLSVNNGDNWTSISTGLPIGVVRSLAISSSNILASVVGGGGYVVYRTTNNGANWSEANTGFLGNPMTLLANGINLFASSDNYGVFLSTNNGTSWTQMNNGLTSPYMRPLASVDSIVFVGGTEAGVFRTTNDGAHWTQMNTGLTSFYVFSLHSNSAYMFAGLGSNGGLWRRALSELTTEVRDGLLGEMPGTFSLRQNYPNPFNPATTISFDLPHAADVSLRVYDILGREVVALVNEHRAAGRHTATWDAAGFVSGVYFYRLQARGFSETKKMMVTK